MNYTNWIRDNNILVFKDHDVWNQCKARNEVLSAAEFIFVGFQSLNSTSLNEKEFVVLKSPSDKKLKCLLRKIKLVYPSVQLREHQSIEDSLLKVDVVAFDQIDSVDIKLRLCL